MSYRHADNTCEREGMISLRKTSNFGVSNESAIFVRSLLTELTGMNRNIAPIGIPRNFSYSSIPNEEITLLSRRKFCISQDWNAVLVILKYLIMFLASISYHSPN